jgi:hypothetical protein
MVHDNKMTGKGTALAAIAVLLLAIMAGTSLGFEASGGSISSYVGLGTISLNTNSSNILGGLGLASYYVDGTIEGYFGLKFNQNDQVSDNTPPDIYLEYPQNNAVITHQNVSFNFTVSDASGLKNCSLYVDSVRNLTIYDPFNGQNSLNTSIGAGRHDWRIECYDIYGNSRFSQNRHLEMILVSGFDGDSTDLSTENISEVKNLTLSKSGKGKIKFSTPTNLSGIYDLESNIVITHLSISINSSNLPALDKPATLTIYSVPYQNIVILKDGVVCNSCTIGSFSGGILVFDVLGFSTYTITSTSQLDIFDETDTTTREVFQNVRYFANYTNVSSGLPIDSECEISYDLSGWTIPVWMAYNASSGLHEYNRSFNFSDTFAFNISCQALSPGFDELSLIENTIISKLTPGSFAALNLTTTSSTRYDDSKPAEGTSGRASNLTELTLQKAITSGAWQGYFGNISGDIELSDASGNSLYDWDSVSVSGEILASRSPNVDWSTIDCIDPAVMSNENSWLSKSSLDTDSLESTFNMTDHPSFLIASKEISSCESTRTFRDTSQTGFWNVLLSDNFGSAVYTGILSAGNTNFQNRQSDFELLVPVPSDTISIYYFYLELS